MNGERTIAAKTRPRKRSAADVAPAAEMHTAAEMPAAMTAEMAATVKMPSASVTTSTMAPAAVATAASRGCITSSRQRGRKNNDGNANIEFGHHTLRRRRHLNLR
jgi:hypothetical protein